ncbi:MAG TPA: alpha/beta fold hydrolase [Beijerinckiaceae bacterium]
MERRSAALPHGALSVLEAGAGEALVLLHGVGSAARSWRAQIEALSATHRVLAWDAPGYGDSAPLPAEAPDAGDYAQAVADWLDATGVGRAHVVGHSLGALIAARFARLHPARTLSLTLASCALGHARLPAEERTRLLESRLADVRDLGPRGMAEKRGPRLLAPGADPALVAGVVDAMASVRPHGYAQAARMLSGGDLVGDLRALPADPPVQFVWGSADVITPPAANETAAAARPDAPRHVIAGAGHACYIERASTFNDIVATFTRSHGQGRGL